MSEELLYFNGIDGETGDYLVDPVPADELSKIALGNRWWDKAHISELAHKHEESSQAHYAPMAGLDASSIEETGWGLIFPAHAEPEEVAGIRDALKVLTDHRKKQAGPLFKVYYREDDQDPSEQLGYLQGQTKDEFLQEHGAGPGPVDPELVPFYLLIVGDPQSIPYMFQYELDVQYAVGRIHFDTLEEYAQYASSVVQAETGTTRLPRKGVFFGVANEDDRATKYSAEMLVKPLAEYIDDKKDKLNWETEVISHADATKGRLETLLGGKQTPAFLFSASHGLGFSNGSDLQKEFQGALLCDTEGPIPHGEGIDRKYYVGGEDIASDKNLLGMIAFHFACYGAGTPYLDDYFMRRYPDPKPLAPYAFLAPLPKRMLSHPNGGALAVVGHVDRAWSYSFNWKDAGAQTTAFKSTLYQMLNGKTIGDAMDYLNLRYAEIATMLSNAQSKAAIKKFDSREIVGLWTANNDARGFTVIGDPAVRMPIAGNGEATAQRETIKVGSSKKGSLKPVMVPDSIPGYEASETDDEPASMAVSEPPPSPAPTQSQQYGVSVQGQTVLHGWMAMSELADAEEMDFAPGGDTAKKVFESLTNALKNMTTKLAEFAEDVSGLEVETYVSDDIESVSYDMKTNGYSEPAKKRALTHISLDGDTQVCVPMEAGDLDETLWEIHNEMVSQAIDNRMQMIKAAADVLAGLLSPK